jgi:signal transduction histidine kinase
MVRRFLEWVLRARYGFPIVVLAALLVTAVNELTHRHSVATLTRGIRLTDIRIKAAQTLQLVTDAETSVRGYLITGNEAHLAGYRQALVELPLVQNEAFALIAKVNTEKKIPVDDVKKWMAAKLGDLALLRDLKSAGNDTQANMMDMSNVDMNNMTALREAFHRTLQSAAAVQSATRVTLYDAMGLTRWTVHLLIWVTLTGLYFLMRQLGQADLLRQTETERLEKQVRSRTTELRELAGHLVRAREDERRRLARELHDDLGALLTVTKLDIARVKRQEGISPVVRERFAAIEQRVNEGISLKRKIIENLRPSALDQLGLIPSLELLCADMDASIDAKVSFELSHVVVPQDLALTLYRMVQESLTNVAKHANAQHAKVTLSNQGDEVILTVEDDGQGFDVDAVSHGHHGLVGLRYRVESHGGALTVTASDKHGTAVCAVIPVASDSLSCLL